MAFAVSFASAICIVSRDGNERRALPFNVGWKAELHQAARHGRGDGRPPLVLERMDDGGGRTTGHRIRRTDCADEWWQRRAPGAGRGTPAHIDGMPAPAASRFRQRIGAQPA